MNRTKLNSLLMNFSLTISGVIVSIAGTLLLKSGLFTETCTSEILSAAPVIIGGIMSWIGRVRAGGVDALGRRK